MQADRDDFRSQLQQLQAAHEKQQLQEIEDVLEEMLDELVFQEEECAFTVQGTVQDTPVLASSPSTEPQQQAICTALSLDVPSDAAHADQFEQEQLSSKQQQQGEPQAHTAGASDQQEQLSSKQQQGSELQSAQGLGFLQDEVSRKQHKGLILLQDLSTEDCSWEPLLQSPMQLRKAPQQLQVYSCSSRSLQLPGVQLLVKHLLLQQAHRCFTSSCSRRTGS